MKGGPPPLRSGAEPAAGYSVIAHLSRGRTLDVYDAWSAERDCRCVLKVLRPDRAADTAARRRLFREGRLLLRLTHPHVVRAYDLVREPDPALVLETLEGETLDHLIASRDRRLPISELAFLGLHLSSALGYLHRQRIVHLDLKPTNVVVDAGLAKLIDLSIARRPGRVPPGVGTRQYLAPEQAHGGAVDGSADVWGLGAVLFESATARRPFAGRSDGTYEQLERRADPVRSLRRAPLEFDDLVSACLRPDPCDRPTLPEVVTRLEAIAGGGWRQLA